MPSPSEFMPEQDVAAEIHYGESAMEEPRGSATRVIPAIAGGLFAGLLLVGLGCTPLFKPQASKARPEVGTIVTVSSAPGNVDGMLVVGGPSSKAPARETLTPPAATGATSAETPASASTHVVSGIPSVASAASSSAAPAAASIDSHRFAITCDPQHGYEDKSVPRPETVMLQGIMAGQSSKAALLNGTLYREGDRFGSAVCPWTVAMIDAAGVRIEKAFGDRVCGVTIHLQNSDRPQVAKAPAPTSAKPRSGSMSNSRSR